jgi:hypothetical protein
MLVADIDAISLPFLFTLAASDLRMNALVAAWRPGVEGGHALWDLLTGAIGFSGRLAQARRRSLAFKSLAARLMLSWQFSSQAWPHNAGAAHFGGISPWYSKYCSEECPHLTVRHEQPLFCQFRSHLRATEARWLLFQMDMVTDNRHGLSLDPSSPQFPFGCAPRANS